MKCPVKPYIFSSIAQPMGLGALSVLFPLKIFLHTAWTVNDTQSLTQYIQRKQKRIQEILTLCKFHYCDFSKHSINVWLIRAIYFIMK